jgi:chaperone BCS1
MNGFLDALTAAFQNQFLMGGGMLMIMGAVMALCRRTPFTVWRWLQRRCSVTVDVTNCDPVFDWLSEWLDAHPYSKRATRLTVSSKASLTKEGARTVIFTPAPGNHFFIYQRRLVWLNRERNASGGGKDDDAQSAVGSMFRQRETYTLRIVGRSQDVARQLVEDARQCAQKAARKAADLYISSMWYWSRVGEISPRGLESVILPEGMSERLVADVQEFLDSREWYAERGIPYRRGYLLEGVPGSGKSSLIRALSSSLNLNLYMLNIGSPGMTDEKLTSLMSEIKDNSILLLEDIDAAARRPLVEQTASAGPGAETKGITFSGLLNALDGVNAREGVMVFMTTNHKERLDDALIRPGRVDVQEHFDHATKAQVARMFSHFYPGLKHGLATYFAEAMPPETSMAAVQQLLLLHKQSAEDSVKAATALRTKGAHA